VSQRSPSSEPMFNVPPAALANGGRARARPRGAAAAFAHLISYRGADDRRLRGDFRHDGCGDALVFQQGGALAVWRRQSDGKSYRVPASPLFATLREPRFLIFLAVWIGLNALFGLGTLPIAEEGQQVAWQAHIGGFLAGLVLFNAFDPAVPQEEGDAGPRES